MEFHSPAASNPSLRKGKGKGIGKGKDIGSSDDEPVAITKPSALIRGEEMDIDGSDDEPVAFTKPSASTTGPIPIPSSASASSSKRKYSALGEDESAVSSSRTSYSSGKRKPHTTALDRVKESLDVIGTSLHELASEHKLRRLQLDARADAAHE